MEPMRSRVLGKVELEEAGDEAADGASGKVQTSGHAEGP